MAQAFGSIVRGEECWPPDKRLLKGMNL